MSVEGDGEYLYADVLRSERWQEIRALLRAFYGRCQICGASEELDVHHLHYRTLGQEEPPDLLLVCRGCHGRIHDGEIASLDYQQPEPASWSEIAAGRRGG